VRATEGSLNLRRSWPLPRCPPRSSSDGGSRDESLAKKNDCLRVSRGRDQSSAPRGVDVRCEYACRADAEDQVVHSIRDCSTGQWATADAVAS